MSYRNDENRQKLSCLVEFYHDNLTVKQMSLNEGGERTLFMFCAVKLDLQKVLLANINKLGFDNYGASLMFGVLP